MTLLEELQWRGLVAQMTHEEETRELLEKERVTFYIGFDPTGDSLHIGHFMQMIVMKHMQNAGHIPIALVGGGTAMIPDPTGKDDMRKIMTVEEIQHNADCLKKQMSKFIDFADGKAIMVNNADWLLGLNYINFLREVGMHFSVNRMLAAECFKSRLERGLSFIEFNYMLMQGYDFYVLNQKYGCRLQLGGDDQWSNIIGGVELIRRKGAGEAYGMTFTLLTTSEGKKMGKTEKGALWIDAEKTSPYDFYQYWRNVDDKDVIRMLKLVTFLPITEIEKMQEFEGQQLNEAKKVLAYEVTKMVHGEHEANKAQEAASAVFAGSGSSADMPSTVIAKTEMAAGRGILDLLVLCALASSKSEARRLVEQGGVSINGERIESAEHIVDLSEFINGEIIIKKGKKIYHRITLE